MNKKFKASGIIGETIAKARIIQTSPLMIAHPGLIILGLGSSLKSAPRIPKLKETILKEEIKKNASTMHRITIFVEGVQTTLMTSEHTTITAEENSVTKAYLALTRRLASIGDEYMYQTESPSNPIIMVPRVIAMMVPGTKVKYAEMKR